MNENRCGWLWHVTLTPGRADSPDGPSRNIALRCLMDRGHGGEHDFPEGDPDELVAMAER